MYYIGVDLGTSAVKLLLMESDGTIANIVSEDYPISFPHPGWSEQNPEDWWKAVQKGIRELLKDHDSSKVAGISFGGQMHGLVVLDKKDNVIRPAILWNDGRTQKETDYLNTVIGKDKLSDYCANIAFAGFTAPKILWMKANEPDNFARIDKIMLPKDYIAYKLSGVHCTDVSDASGMLLFDVRNKKWSHEMCEICGISENMLAEIFESYDTVGCIKSDVAESLGLRPDVRIAAGAGDNAAAAVGTGTVGDGMCNISLGTSGTIFISSHDFRVDKFNSIHAFAHADGHYHLMGCMLSAASCKAWFINDILETNDFKFEESKIPDEMLGRNNIFFMPYLMGERCPYNDPGARAAFIGMSMDSTRTDMLQAVMEGISFGIRDSFEIARSLGIDIRRTKICGGGSKGDLSKKMMADILNIDVDVPENEQGPSMGGAMLAAVACGEYSSVEDAAEKIVKIRTTVHPDPETAARYEEKYARYRKLYPLLKEWY